MDNKNIEEFGRTLAIKTKDRLGEGYDTKYKVMEKNNGTVKHGIVIRKEELNISPTVYIDAFYEDYRNGRNISDILDGVIASYEQYMPSGNVDVSFFEEFESASDRLAFRLMGIRENKEYLKNIPYRKFENLAMVPVCIVRDDIIGEGMITINDSHLESWGITKRKLWKNLKETAAKVAPVKMIPMVEMLDDRFLGDVGTLKDIIIVTNQSKNYGAGAVLYPGVLKSIAEKCGRNLYVLPASVHEVIVLPESDKAGEKEILEEIVRNVNADVLGRDDFLSDMVYYYNKDEETFGLCG
ncbi:MAG: hypothetical protein J5802_05320 [Butyrivibrio sp.]|nr:hypothetical protein [Butyrivibrio sp.]